MGDAQAAALRRYIKRYVEPVDGILCTWNKPRRQVKGLTSFLARSPWGDVIKKLMERGDLKFSLADCEYAVKGLGVADAPKA